MIPALGMLNAQLSPQGRGLLAISQLRKMSIRERS
jgi:hypothetical protein